MPLATFDHIFLFLSDTLCDLKRIEVVQTELV